MHNTKTNSTHKAGCPQRYDHTDECMCDYIKAPAPVRKRKLQRMTCPSNVKRFALEFAALNGRSRFRRCSGRFLEAIERNTMEFIQRAVKAQQLKGMTLK